MAQDQKQVGVQLPMTCRYPLIAFASSQLDSLRTWKVFASLFAIQRSDRTENKKLVLSGSNMNITECIKHIDSPSFHFITFLNLSDFSCSRSDLIHLSRLPNLGMLTISTQDPSWVTLEDSIVRAWGRAASETGAFSRLRILVCRFQTYITAKSFVYLQDFPALDLVLLDQCRVSKGLTNQAAQQEWHAKEYSRLRSDAVDLPAWKDIYSGLLKKGALLDIEAMHKPFENDEDSEPILDVSLGLTASSASRLLTLSSALSGNTWLFRRKGRCNHSSSLASSFSQKRSLAGNSVASSRSFKRPALRTSRQRTMEDLLADFQT